MINVFRKLLIILTISLLLISISSFFLKSLYLTINSKLSFLSPIMSGKNKGPITKRPINKISRILLGMNFRIQ